MFYFSCAYSRLNLGVGIFYHGMRSLTELEKQIIIESGLFDPLWYSSEYPDVSYSGLQPLEHYLRIGIKLGRNPCRLFDRQFYLSQFKDSSQLPECPLLDYLQEGWRQRRNPHQLFDLARYLDQNEDIKLAGIEPLGQYLSRGISEGRQLGPTPKDALDSMQLPSDDQPNSPASEDVRSPGKKAPLFKSNIESAEVDFIRGWCVNLKKPGEVFEVEAFLDGISFASVRNKESRLDLKNAGLSKGLGGIMIPNPAAYLDEGKHTISLRFPNGTFSEAFELEGKRSIPDRLRITDRIPHRPVTIIVPIHNAAEDVRICIERLLAHTPEFAKILLIDDCSTDPRIAEILSLHETNSNIKILKNGENCGFTRTVNRGIQESAEDDVILLNSDARVTPRWLESMLVAAYSSPRIATVTAMSDRAGAFSAPQIGNDNTLPEGVDEISYARAFRRRSLGLYPRVPTGNGFCMFINRECIQSIGMLDAQAFPRGYGEENDFCMRAVRAGWQHIIDDRTYVFHDRSKSFGEAKTGLLSAGRAVLDERYPEYGKAIRVFHTCNKIGAARYRARLAMQDCMDRPEKAWIPRALFVVSTQTGGTPQTNRDLIQALSGAIEGWVLRCDSKILELSRMDHDGNLHIVQSRRLLETVDPLTHNSAEYDTVVSSWLQEFDFDLVHIRHLGWHGLSLPRLARQLGMKVIYSFHDFYALSSTFKLIDDTGVFLGNTYLAAGSVYRESLWPKDALPTPHGTWLTFWRERFQAALEHCDAYVTTAASARDLILVAMPRLPPDRFLVIPHGRDFPKFHRIRQKPKPGEPLRILVPGHINAVKGLEIIRALIEHDETAKLEFHILGGVYGEKPSKGLVDWGTYERLNFAQKVREIQPHIGIVFSVWDETYCHTLTELWSVGLPAAVLDFPNVADRVRRSGAGWILDHRQISKLYEEILRVAFDEREYERTEQALGDWQAGYGLANSAKQMAAGYLNIYSDVLREGTGKTQSLSPHSRKRIGVVCPASPDLRHAPGSTHIRIWERTLNTVERNVTYLRMTPEMLIASTREKMIDGAIIQRNAIPKDMVDNTIHALDQARIPYALDLDDDLLDVPADKDPTGIYAAYATALQKLISKSSAITVSTHPLLTKLSAIHPYVSLLYNNLSDRLWRNKLQNRDIPKSLRVLYMGSPSHDDDLNLVLPSLDAYSRLVPEFKLALVGVTNRKDIANERSWLEVMNVPDKNYVNFTRWLQGLACQFDFAIAPLRETSFNNLKSDLKLLEYGALGLPVIASDCGAYKSSNAPGVRLVANSTDAWTTALLEQSALKEKNHTLGYVLRQWVLRERMLEKTLPEYDKFVLGLIGQHGGKIQEVNRLATSAARIAVCAHIFYPHKWNLISKSLKNIKQEFDLFITCPKEIANQITIIKKEYPNATIHPVDNAGMDVLPFLTLVKIYSLEKYGAILKIHTKNDKAKIGDILGRLALDGVLGTPVLVDRILTELVTGDKIGIVGSECLYRSAIKVMYANRPNVEKSLNTIGAGWPDTEWGFFAGTMFWIRGSLLKPLSANYEKLAHAIYSENEINTTGGDGNWPHAMERVFGFLPAMGNQSVAVSVPENDKSGHTHLRKVSNASRNSKMAYHGFSVDDLYRYENLSVWSELCRESELFDKCYYRSQAGEYLPLEMDEATHYVLFGDILNINPSKKFSNNDYFRKNIDAANVKPSIPSLVHYLQHGAKEGRPISRVSP